MNNWFLFNPFRSIHLINGSKPSIKSKSIINHLSILSPLAQIFETNERTV